MKTNLRYFVLAGVAVVVVAIVLWMASRGGSEDIVPEVPPDDIAEQPMETPPTPSVARRAELPFGVPERDEPEETGAETEAASPQTGEGRIHGRVVAGEGAMPARITIELYHVSWERLDAPKDDALRLSVQAGADGAFDFPDLPFGHFFVHAFAPNVIGTASIDLSRESPESEREIDLRISGPMAGVVLDQAGRPVPGALVYIRAWRQSGYVRPASGAGGLYFRDTTDEAGRFQIDQGQVRPNPVDYQLVAVAEGFAIAFTEFITVGDKNVVIRLEPGEAVNGVAVFADTGKPAAGFTLMTHPSAPLHRNKTTTAEDGSFSFDRMSAGSYSIDVIDDVYIIDSGTGLFDVADGAASSDIRIAIIAGGIVSGFVKDKESSEGISGVTLRVNEPQGVEIYGELEATTAADGYYAFKGLKSGDYEVYLRRVEGYGRGGMSRDDTRSVAVRAPGEVPNVDFALSRGLRIGGIVVDKTGAPVAEAYISAQGQTTGGMPSYENATSKADGTFLVGGLLAQTTYQVSVQKQGHASAAVPAVEIANDSVFDIRLVMPDGGSIAGKVVDRSGRPVAKVRVGASDRSSGLWAGRSAPTGADGQFTIADVAPGTYQFQFGDSSGSFHYSGAAGNPEVTVNEGETVTGVRLVYDKPEELVIAGRVRDSSGSPISGATIRNRYGSSGTSTDADGRFELQLIDQYGFGLVVEHRDYTTVTLNEAPPRGTNLDITMRGRGVLEGRVIDAGTREAITEFSLYNSTGASPFGYIESQRGQAHADPDGRFRIDNAEEGTQTLIVSASGYATLRYEVPGVEEDETIDGIVIALAHEAILEGVVTNPVGQIVAGALVFVGETDNRYSSRDANATTDLDGRFRIDALEPGQLTVMAYHKDFASGTVNVDLASRRVTEVEIRLTGGGTIEGVIYGDDGRPAQAEISARIEHDDGTSEQVRGSVGPDGRYRLDNVPPGAISLSVYGGQIQGRNHEAAVQVSEGETVTFDSRAE